MKYIILILLLISCALEPEKEYIYQDRIVYVETVTGMMPLQFSNANMIDGQGGVLFWAVVYNPTNSSWYGHPILRIYSIEEEIEMDDTFDLSDLLYNSSGVLTMGIDSYTWLPIDSVGFVPSNSYRWAWAVVEVDRNKLKSYSYYLWGFVEDGV